MPRKNELITRPKRRRKSILKDQQAGNLIEYGLLIAFAIFLFLIIVVIVTQIIDDTTGGVFKLNETFVEWWKPDFTTYFKYNTVCYTSFKILLIIY